MPNNFTLYQQSIASEFLSIKDRVHFFIGNNHHGENGRYREIILINFLKRILPDSVGVGTGFVKNNQGNLTKQIDIIVFKKDYPKLFSEGDFVILVPESVLGIIEVKSKVYFSRRSRYTENWASNINNANFNGNIIGNKDIFNGIFSYSSDITIDEQSINNILSDKLNSSDFLNHICLNQDFFCKYWDNGNPIDRYGDPSPCYSFYDLSSSNVFNNPNENGGGLAFGYFISNLLERVYRFTNPEVLSHQYFEFLYPLENTKEAYRLRNCDIKVVNSI